MKYKAIVHTPFHNIGDVIDDKDYNWNPRKFPDLFEEVIIEFSDMSEDGFLLHEYDNCYYISDDFHVKPFSFQGGITDKMFHTYSNAVDYINSLINIKLDDGEVVIGFVEKVYGVCTTSSWQEETLDSLTLFRKKIRGTGISPSWKFFKSEESREEYIKWNRPLYSLNDIKIGNHLLNQNGDNLYEEN